MNPATSFLLTFPPHIRAPKSQAGKRDVSKWDAEPSWGDMEGRRTSGRFFHLHPCHPTLGHHAALTTRQPSAATWALEWSNCSQPHAAPTSCALRCHRAHVAGRPPNTIYQHSHQNKHSPGTRLQTWLFSLKQDRTSHLCKQYLFHFHFLTENA